jgi:hypothetical protein
VDRDSHQRPLDHRAPLERAPELIALEPLEPRPEADVHRRRVLRLEAADALERTRKRLAAALQQQLASEHRAIELALREHPLGADRHGLQR